MYSQTSAQKGAAFDEIYAKVPAEQVERLKEFRFTHKYKRLPVGGTEWEYISCGRGEQTLLLLPGALSVGESTFPLVTAFEEKYRIIAPSYALSLTMTGLCDGIAHILETESVNQAHVLGGSYGGLVAQYFVRKYPDNDSVIILRGECNKLEINGCCNTITVDVVAHIILNSADNTVRWKKAAKGKQPKVDSYGTGSKVEQVKQ